jgi:cytochrome bd ubiquinol oxidase subunit I
LPFAFEGLSFFTEAIFLGLYLYGWDRMRPRWQLAMLVPMAISGIVGSFCVVAVNSWMNYPTGFTIREGVVADVDPWAAMFNPLAWLQFLHMWLGAFLLVGLVVAGVYAAGLLRGRTDAHHRLGFAVPFGFASIAAVIQPFVGHVLGLQVGHKQSSKLAAFELALHTEPGPAPLRLGGFLIGDKVQWALSFPGSARSSPAARSTGRFPVSTRFRNPSGRRSISRTGPFSRWSASVCCWHLSW